MTRRRVLQAAAAALASPLLTACGGGGGGGGGGSPPPAGSDSLLALVQGNSDFSLFASALSKSGLDRYGAAGDLTLFAPTNAAMNALGSSIGLTDGSGLVAGLSSAQWEGILNYSTLPQGLSFSQLNAYAQNGTRPDTLYSFEDKDNAKQLIFQPDNGVIDIVGGVGSPTIDAALSNVGASNGVLHVVTAPVVPRGVLTILQMLRESSPGFVARMGSSTLTLLGNASSRSTVFVPSVDVGSISDTEVRHHILGSRLDSNNFTSTSLQPLAGQQLVLSVSSNPDTLRNATGGAAAVSITDVDFWGNNGVIHVISGVIPL